VDLEAGCVWVRASVAELRNGVRVTKLPKSMAGVRTVPIPSLILPELRRHLDRYAEPGTEGQVFVGAEGATPRRSHFNKIWHRACDAAEIKGLHFHDLRHTGNNFAAAAGASTKELMARFGHSSMRAALIYQHANDADSARSLPESTPRSSPASNEGTRATGTPGELDPWNAKGPGWGSCP
jgi:integrase